MKTSSSTGIHQTSGSSSQSTLPEERVSSWLARKKKSSNRRVIEADTDRLASQYITNPHLIKGHKYDLRVYALVTCLDPLRVGLF